MSDSYLPPKIATTQECKVQWNFQSQYKNLLKRIHFKDCPSQKFIATTLVTYVTIFPEHDLALQNYIRASQYEFYSVLMQVNLGLKFVIVSNFAQVNFPIFQKKLGNIRDTLYVMF